jgi:hypothetical protein
LYKLKTGLGLRGFLAQCKEAMTRRASGTQGIDDEAMRQKGRKSKPVFSLYNYKEAEGNGKICAD